MTEWEADSTGLITNGPGTLKKGDKIRLVGYEGVDRLLEVTETPKPKGGAVTIEVRQIEP